jgi:hypothetical protein
MIDGDPTCRPRQGIEDDVVAVPSDRLMSPMEAEQVPAVGQMRSLASGEAQESKLERAVRLFLIAKRARTSDQAVLLFRLEGAQIWEAHRTPNRRYD